MYSFYGGKPGAPFVIVASFSSVQEMVDNFKLGADYTTVHYDEYVIINTSGSDNGKIYRRGYNFTDETTGGAEYIGTIAGPAGESPVIEMDTVENISDIQATGDYTTGSYTVTNNSLVPGKNGNLYNDDIQWACLSVAASGDDAATAYIGFKVPYPVIDFEAAGVAPYSGGSYTDMAAATREDDGSHPFYEKWHLDIPKGIKGDSLKNLTVQVASQDIESYVGKTDDINGQRQVIVYEEHIYDDTEAGTVKKYYLGDYNMISDISMDSAGTLTIEYTHNDDTSFVNAVKWISSCEIDTGETEGTGTQTIKLTWNDGTVEYVGNPLNYIMEMVIDENNNLLVWYSDPLKRAAGGVTYDGRTGWTNIGQIIPNSQQAESAVTNKTYIGSGILIDNGYSNKTIQFNMTPMAFLSTDITTITMTSGWLSGWSSDGITIDSLNVGGGATTVTKDFTGLQFVVTTNLASSGTESTSSINFVIRQLGLSFTS